jgi:hypothetical protein
MEFHVIRFLEPELFQYARPGPIPREGFNGYARRGRNGVELAMTPLDLTALSTAAPDRSLEMLEAGVWSRVAAEDLAARRLTPLASAQALLFVVAVGASAMIGGTTAARAQSHMPELGVFSPNAVLTPSSRLLGAGR